MGGGVTELKCESSEKIKRETIEKKAGEGVAPFLAVRATRRVHRDRFTSRLQQHKPNSKQSAMGCNNSTIAPGSPSDEAGRPPKRQPQSEEPEKHDPAARAKAEAEAAAEAAKSEAAAKAAEEEAAADEMDPPMEETDDAAMLDAETQTLSLEEAMAEAARAQALAAEGEGDAAAEDVEDAAGSVDDDDEDAANNGAAAIPRGSSLAAKQAQRKERNKRYVRSAKTEPHSFGAIYGDQFKGKKGAKGDVLRTGSNGMQPFSYMPLAPKLLGKKHQAKAAVAMKRLVGVKTSVAGRKGRHGISKRRGGPSQR